MKKLLFFLSLVILISCSDNSTKQEQVNSGILVEGSWLLQFKITETNNIPVNFNLTKVNDHYQVEFLNAEEKIIANDVVIKGNQISIKDPVFNVWFEGNIVDATTIEGNWYKDGQDYKVPFVAKHGKIKRFESPEVLSVSSESITGRWEVDFSKDNEEDHYKAIGQFKHVDNYLTGTFMTETGDYRFLEGNVYNDSLYLSCYDGAHLFLFKAQLKNDSLIGTFWSGIHWQEPWVAVRNKDFKLTNPDSLTFLKDGYTNLAFTFPNLNGDSVSLSDEKYAGKVVIVNIMGPWCPNCKDETAYLTELYDQYHEKGLEIIALSYNKSEDFETAKNNTLKVKEFFGAKYDFLIAGQANKISAGKTLPMLNHIMSFPTSIFIDRKGNIRKIRTGFYGPGTGTFYKRYIERTNDFTAKLLSEKTD